MRLTDLVEEKTEKGTYAGLRFGDGDEDKIMSLIKKMGIPNPISREDIHLTLLYSRKYLPNYKAAQDTDMWAYPDDFHIFKGFDDKEILVLLLKSDDAHKRHKFLMKEHGATYDYPEYKPHITLSYDVDGYMSLEEIKEKFTSILPKEFHIASEYMEELKLEWKQKD